MRTFLVSSLALTTLALVFLALGAQAIAIAVCLLSFGVLVCAAVAPTSKDPH